MPDDNAQPTAPAPAPTEATTPPAAPATDATPPAAPAGAPEATAAAGAPPAVPQTPAVRVTQTGKGRKQLPPRSQGPKANGGEQPPPDLPPEPKDERTLGDIGIKQAQPVVQRNVAPTVVQDFVPPNEHEKTVTDKTAAEIEAGRLKVAMHTERRERALAAKAAENAKKQ